MISSAPRAMHRLLTFLWCVMMVAALGLGARASAAETLVSEGIAQLRQAPEPDSQFGMPPSTGDVGEDSESEKSSGADDSVDRTEARSALELGSGMLASVRAGRLALRSSQAFERRQHNRGPPA